MPHDADHRQNRHKRLWLFNVSDTDLNIKTLWYSYVPYPTRYVDSGLHRSPDDAQESAPGQA